MIEPLRCVAVFDCRCRLRRLRTLATRPPLSGLEAADDVVLRFARAGGSLYLGIGHAAVAATIERIGLGLRLPLGLEPELDRRDPAAGLTLSPAHRHITALVDVLNCWFNDALLEVSDARVLILDAKDAANLAVFLWAIGGCRRGGPQHTTGCGVADF
jgi:hypothetical protein